MTDDTERHLEQLHRGVLENSGLGDPYIVLSQHQMQNLGNNITKNILEAALLYHVANNKRSHLEYFK